MRLSTLARKINITPKQLIAYLNQKGIEVENGLHSKLEKDITDMVMEHFLPEDQVKVPEPAEKIEETTEIELPEDESKLDDEKIVLEEITSPQENVAEVASASEVENEQKVGTVEDLESEDFEKIELIKAKKVKLEGIKVVGKIDLPEKPKKEPAETSIEEELDAENKRLSRTKPASGNRNFNRDRKKKRHGKNHTPSSYEDKLKEEEREKLKKRRRRENAEKRRKKKYYQEHIEPKISQRQKKNKKSNNSEVQNPGQKKEVIVHKNPIKRFWAWLNGKYDKY